MIIGCDIDGILTDYSAHNIREGAKVFRRAPVNPAGYGPYDIFDVSDIPKPILYAKAFGAYYRYCRREPPRPDAPEVLRNLVKHGNIFYAVTAREFTTHRGLLGSAARKWCNEWLKLHRIPFRQVFFCSEKRGPQEKLSVCRRLGVELMIEDKPENALCIAEHGIPVIMIDAPYNLQTVHDRIFHVPDWKALREMILHWK